jgi:hypothetical protein
MGGSLLEDRAIPSPKQPEQNGLEVVEGLLCECKTLSSNTNPMYTLQKKGDVRTHRYFYGHGNVLYLDCNGGTYFHAIANPAIKLSLPQSAG